MSWQTGVSHSTLLAVEERELEIRFGYDHAVDEAAAGCLADVAAHLGGLGLGVRRKTAPWQDGAE